MLLQMPVDGVEQFTHLKRRIPLMFQCAFLQLGLEIDHIGRTRVQDFDDLHLVFSESLMPPKNELRL